MTGEVAKLAKPPRMRGMLHRQIKVNLAVTCGFVLLSGLIRHMINVDKKNKVAVFYQNYDIEKEFEIMREKKVFQSC